MKLRFNKKGFTLLEAIIAISVVGVMGLILSDLMIRGFKGSNKTVIIGNVKQNGTVAMNVIEQSIRKADSVVCLSSVTAEGLSKTMVLQDKSGAFLRFNVVAPAASSNGYITADDPTKSVTKVATDDTCSSVAPPAVPGAVDFNPVCAQRLCDSDYSTFPTGAAPTTNFVTNRDNVNGVSVNSGGFKRKTYSAGIKDAVEINLGIGPARMSGYDFSTQLKDDVQFSNTIQIR
jgi:prepilin-type N-terminal cleavage/methylation domain-containing protein